jgi:hypothetical protein
LHSTSNLSPNAAPLRLYMQNFQAKAQLKLDETKIPRLGRGINNSIVWYFIPVPVQ